MQVVVVVLALLFAIVLIPVGLLSGDQEKLNVTLIFLADLVFLGLGYIIYNWWEANRRDFPKAVRAVGIIIMIPGFFLYVAALLLLPWALIAVLGIV